MHKGNGISSCGIVCLNFLCYSPTLCLPSPVHILVNTIWAGLHDTCQLTFIKDLLLLFTEHLLHVSTSHTWFISWFIIVLWSKYYHFHNGGNWSSERLPALHNKHHYWCWPHIWKQAPWTHDTVASCSPTWSLWAARRQRWHLLLLCPLPEPRVWPSPATSHRMKESICREGGGLSERQGLWEGSYRSGKMLFTRYGWSNTWYDPPS